VCCVDGSPACVYARYAPDLTAAPTSRSCPVFGAHRYHSPDENTARPLYEQPVPLENLPPPLSRQDRLILDRLLFRLRFVPRLRLFSERAPAFCNVFPSCSWPSDCSRSFLLLHIAYTTLKSPSIHHTQVPKKKKERRSTLSPSQHPCDSPSTPQSQLRAHHASNTHNGAISHPHTAHQCLRTDSPYTPSYSKAVAVPTADQTHVFHTGNLVQ
jgi:hypothetical protein